MTSAAVGPDFASLRGGSGRTLQKMRLRSSKSASSRKTWIEARKRQRAQNRRFNRKSSLKVQLVIFAVICMYVLLPQQAGSTAMEYVFGPSETSGLHRQLDASMEASRALSATNGTDNSTLAEEAAGSEFPDPPFTHEQMGQGAIVVVLFIMFYCFLGLAIVCDEYFESSLEAICEDLNLKEDVAGATFMAAGGSAPELFSSIIGVFIAKSDIGFGTIVGSATFNVLFVIAMCSFITYNLTLSWWPLTRDCVFYCASIILLVFCVIDDQQINTLESVLLLLMYACYITIMYYNERLETWMTAKVEVSLRPPVGWRATLLKCLNHDLFNYFIYAVIMANVVIIIMSEGSEETPLMADLNTFFSIVFVGEFFLKCVALTFIGYWHDPVNAFDGTLVVLILIEYFLASTSVSGGLRGLRVFRFLRMARALRIVRIYHAFHVKKFDAVTQTEDHDWEVLSQAQAGQLVTLPPVEDIRRRSSASVAPLPASAAFPDAASKEDAGEGRLAEGTQAEDGEGEGEGDAGSQGSDDSDDGPTNPFEVPEDASKFELFLYYLSFPLAVLMFFSIPDCRRDMFKRFYFLTFAMCIVWIAILSYFMIWMAVLFGDFAGISDPVMGLTLIAAGTSVPDLLSSMAVARRGFGDMAVSSSVGSNVFDILIGLPVPWFIKTTIVDPGTIVEIHSCGLTIMVLTLFLMVAAVVSLIHWCGWIMSRRLGVAMVVLYFLFMAESLLLESGVLGSC